MTVIFESLRLRLRLRPLLGPVGEMLFKTQTLFYFTTTLRTLKRNERGRKREKT